MKTQDDMKKDFHKGFEEFLQSDKNTVDYMKLFVAFRNATTFGSGLMYGQIEETINELLDKGADK